MTKEDILKLDFYGWSDKGMKENPTDVPNDDVFVLRQDVLDVLEGYNPDSKPHKHRTDKQVEQGSEVFSRDFVEKAALHMCNYVLDCKDNEVEEPETEKEFNRYMNANTPPAEGIGVDKDK